jgi:hypothetical protein
MDRAVTAASQPLIIADCGAIAEASEWLESPTAGVRKNDVNGFSY